MQTRLCLVFLAMLAALVSLCGPAPALVGEAGPADIAIQRYTILVYSSKGRCSGVVLAQDLVLTAAHCVEWPEVSYLVGGVVGINQFTGVGVAEIARHPDFRKPTSGADLALLKLAKPLSERFTPAFLQVRPASSAIASLSAAMASASPASLRSRPTLRSAALRRFASLAGAHQLVDLNRDEAAGQGPATVIPAGRSSPIAGCLRSSASCPQATAREGQASSRFRTTTAGSSKPRRSWVRR